MADERVADEDIAVQEKLKRRELKKKRKEVKKMVVEQQEHPEIEDSTAEKKKKKKKDKDHEEEEDSDSSEKISEEKKKKEEKKKSNQIDAKDSENIDESEKSEEKKKKHKKSAKKSGEMISNGENNEEIEEREGKKKKKRHSEGEIFTDGENCEEIDKGEGKKKKKRHRDVEENAEGGDVEHEVKEKRKKKKQKDADSDASSSPNKSKNVRFSADVEAFDQNNAINGEEEKEETEEERNETDQFVKKSKKKRKRALFKLGFNVSEGEVVRGKRFTPGEDQLIMEAVLEYIRKQGYGIEEGLERVLNCKKHKEDSQCWKNIASALPWRPLKSVYLRAHILYQRSKERFWTQDEIKQLISLQAKHGNKWKDIANVLGKHRTHVKDTWRRIKRKHLIKGKPWTQEEYDQLFVLVNANLDLNSSDKQKGSNPMVRQNLNWEAIADVMETRNPANICHKWYHNIMPKMVQTGEWEMRDDYKLLKSLLETNASHEDAVDWSMLVDNRSAETCLKRWHHMLKHLGEYINKPFQDRLEILAGRYAPDLLL